MSLHREAYGRRVGFLYVEARPHVVFKPFVCLVISYESATLDNDGVLKTMGHMSLDHGTWL